MKLESIYAHNEKDPNNPEVLVRGIGRYSFEDLKRNVKEKLAELNRSVGEAETADEWKKIHWMIRNEALDVMLEAIIRAQEELEGR